MESVVEELRQRRLSLGLGQRALAEITGLTQPAIAAYESGTREPGIANVERLAEGLGTRISLEATVDVEALVIAHPTLRREEMLSLVLAHQVAIALLTDPGRTRAIAARNIARQGRESPRALEWTNQWSVLLAGPLRNLVSALVDTSSQAIDLRQSAPFAGVVAQGMRGRLISRLRIAQRNARQHAS
jgi:transcriptional regulator with XRE-family HTH domain